MGWGWGGDSVQEGRGRTLAQAGASETHMRLPRRKAASGSESLTQKQLAKKFPVPSFCSLPSLLLKPWLRSYCSLDYVLWL